ESRNDATPFSRVSALTLRLSSATGRGCARIPYLVVRSVFLIRDHAHRDAARAQVLARLADREVAEVEDAGSQDRVRAADRDALVRVLESARPARGDDRDRDRVGDGARERQVEAVAGAVAVHAGQQDLAGPQLGHARAPGDGVQAGRVAPAVRVHLPAGAGR